MVKKIRSKVVVIWEEQARLTVSDSTEGDRFGFSVTISGDSAVIGAYQDDEWGTDSGSAYIFHYH